MAVFKKSRHQFVVGAVVAAAVTAALVLALAHTRAFELMENGSYDARARWTANRATADKRIVILDIDNASLDTFSGTEMLGRWPWTRRVWTEVVRYIAPGKPRVIAFDVIFAGQETTLDSQGVVKPAPEVDQEFAAVMKDAGNVVLGFTFSANDERVADDAAERAAKLKLLERDAVPATANFGTAPEGANFTLNVPPATLANAAAGLGTVNAVIDRDRATRSMALGWRLGDRVYPSLSLKAAEIAEFNPSGHPGSPQDEAHRPKPWASLVRRVPVNEAGNLQILWHGGDYAYERIPIWQVICSIYPDNCEPAKVYYQPEYFKDRIVMIAASATGSYEMRPTPFSEIAPGFEGHAAAIDNLLHGEAMRAAPHWFLPAAVIALAAVGAGMLVGIGSAIWSSTVLLVVLAGYAGAAYWTFGHQHLWLPLVAPAAALVLSFVSTGTIRFATTGRELRKTRGTLNRYMAPQLVEYVLNNVDNLEFAGEKRELTIFFSDVRNFTTLTEKSDPMVLIAMLNEYLEAMTSTIFKHDGIVDKFIGDGILAYWGAFTPGNHARQAAEASLEMFGRLKELNARWAEMGRPQIDIGVGLNSGEVILGNVGAGKKIEFTVIGDPVNLASRLESLNKEYKCHIIISEFTLARLGDAAMVRSLGGVKVKGKTIETAIYELQGLREESAAAAKN